MKSTLLRATILLGATCFLVAIKTSLLAMEIYDDFSHGAAGWSPLNNDPYWNVVQTSPGVYVYRADLANLANESYSLKTNAVLTTSWRIELDIQFQSYYTDKNSRGLAAITLFPTDSGGQVLADIDQMSDGSVRINVGWFDMTNKVWHTVLNTGWMPGSAPSYHLQLTRLPGYSDCLFFSVLATNGFSFRAYAQPIPILDRMRIPGLRANSTKVNFSHVLISTKFVLPSLSVQPVNQEAVVGQGVMLSVQAVGTAPLNYQWRKDGINLEDASSTSFEIAGVQLADAGNYDVVVSNDGGSVVSSNAMLTVIYPLKLALQLVAGYPLLNLNGMLGSNYVVQYSTNLVDTNWINLFSLTNLSVSLYQFLDLPGAGQPTRFYRAFMQ